VRRYEVLYIGGLCIVTVVFCCASVWGTVYGGFVYFDCGVLLSVGMIYCLMGSLCIVTVVCCCVSVWDTVYGSLCILNVVCCCASVWGTVYWRVCVL